MLHVSAALFSLFSSRKNWTGATLHVEAKQHPWEKTVEPEVKPGRWKMRDLDYL